MHKIDSYTPVCGSHNGSISISCEDPTYISIDWVNLPENVQVFDNGARVYNLPCGVYECSIYNIMDQETEVAYVDMRCSDPLSLDMVQYIDDICESESFKVFIKWSGGDAPYKLKLGTQSIITSSLEHTFVIKPNTKYNLSIKDKNNCAVNKSNISINYDMLKIFPTLKRTQDDGYDVAISTQGGEPPIKFYWYDINNRETPLIQTEDYEINNTLDPGTYVCVAQDSRGCQAQTTVNIPQPLPISIIANIKADYMTNNYYEPQRADTIYNLVLLDKSIDYNTEAKFELKCNNKIYSQNLCMDYGHTFIGKKEFNYFYINPGISESDIKGNQIFLVNGDIEVELESVLKRNTQNKLVKGSLIFTNYFNYCFKENDRINISCNNKTFETVIDTMYILHGYYIQNRVATILNPTINNTDSLAVLNFINTNNDMMVQSLDTFRSNLMGTVSGSISGGDFRSLSIQLFDKDNNLIRDNIKLHTDRFFTIDDLPAGTYFLLVKDEYKNANIFNGMEIANRNTGAFVEILPSEQEELQLMTHDNALKYQVDIESFNLYNKTPRKLIINRESKSGVLINVSPMDADYTISSDDFVYKGSGYGVVEDIPKGKYNIIFNRVGYKSENKRLIVTHNNDMISIIMEKINE